VINGETYEIIDVPLNSKKACFALIEQIAMLKNSENQIDEFTLKIYKFNLLYLYWQFFHRLPLVATAEKPAIS
jgi:hypothetical protein